MLKSRKAILYFVFFILLAGQLLPQEAAAINGQADEIEEVILFSQKPDGKLPLYKGEHAEAVIHEIPDETVVELIGMAENTALIRYLSEKGEEWMGYVHHLHMVPSGKADEFRQARLKPGFDFEKFQESRQLEVQQTYEIQQAADTGQENNGSIYPAATEQFLRGIAAADPVHVYSSTDGGRITFSYKKGDILQYQEHDADFFAIEVTIGGIVQSGYIRQADIEPVESVQTNIKGIAIKSPTHIYSAASTESNVLKSYKYGTILQYRSFTSGWYEATVIIGGETRTGYINKADVGDIDIKLNGYALADPVNVYSGTDRNTPKLKSYKRGSILQYQAYNSSWHQVTVYVSGQARTGYIHANDIGTEPPLIKGSANQHPTYVYGDMSKSAAKLKKYKKGQVMQYRPYNSNWHMATVYVKGKPQKGYIHVKDVSDRPPIFTGHAKHQSTYVFSKTTRNSSKLKAYKKGQLLKYQYYNSSWYKVTVIVKGKAQTGYLHVNDVGAASDISFVNPYQVYSYNQMAADIASLQRAYPELVNYKVVGKSEYGRNIYAVSLGKGKPTAFINGSHHAREWLTTNLNMYMIEQYAKAYDKNSKIKGYDVRKILNGTTIWFIPMVNPDGVTLQQRGLKAFPKSAHASLIVMNNGSANFKRWKANAKGVDLNRQYNAGWATIKGDPGRPSFKNYKGKAPASASEVKAVLKLDTEIDPEMAVAYHSSGKILYWNYKQAGSAYHRDHVYAKAIGNMTGYRLVYPGPNPSGGGYTDWFIQAKKRPGFTPEISKYYYETNPPISEFTGAWKENQAVGLYVAQESAKLYNARKK